MELIPDGSFSCVMVASFWDTPLSSWEMVTSPLTSSDWRVMVVDSVGMVLASVSALKSRRSRGLMSRALLAWARCSAMNARG